MMKIKNELHWYRVEPQVYRTGVISEVTIIANDPRFDFTDEAPYKVEVWSLTRHGHLGVCENPVFVSAKDKKLVFCYRFDKEEEYYIRIFRHDETQRLVQLSVYALDEDLFARRPLRGDLHVHSCRSDGKESPAVVAANYRAAGFDFISLTDHRRFAPSLEMIEAFSDCKLGMTLLTGEEIHSPDNFVHVVNVGSRYSINDIYLNDPDTYRREVEEILKTINTDFLPEAYRFAYAACIWVVKKVREAGGIAIFPHPHWMKNVYNVPDELTEALLMNGVFDVFELIGGFNLLDNNIQIALYNELRARGLRIPIVGSSDSHTTLSNPEVFDARYTVVFALDNSPESIKEAILNGWSIAFEEFYPSNYYMLHGEYRLCLYGKFLRENYFPVTAALCAEEGLLMRQYITGAEGAKEQLEALAGRTEKFYRLMFKK